MKERIVSYIQNKVLPYPGVLFNYMFIIFIFFYGTFIKPFVLGYTVEFVKPFSKVPLWFLWILLLFMIMETVAVVFKILDAPHIAKQASVKKGEIYDPPHYNFSWQFLWFCHIAINLFILIFYGYSQAGNLYQVGMPMVIVFKEIGIFYLLKIFFTSNPEKVRPVSASRRIIINSILGLSTVFYITITWDTYSRLAGQLKNMIWVEALGSAEGIALFNKLLFFFTGYPKEAALAVVLFLFLFISTFFLSLILFVPCRFGFYIEELLTARELKEKRALRLSMTALVLISTFTFYL